LKKILAGFVVILTLSGCAETMALLGPASTSLGGGNLAQSAISTAVNYGVKKQTGKSPMEHAIAYAEKQNKDKKKVKCVEFLEATESEVCTILKKRVSELREKIDINSKIKILD
tara:strand:- start:176 stop:517 length:342 start_codon:yes stop_codon:yes gene_type:complete